jgi:hypothetical protein
MINSINYKCKKEKNYMKTNKEENYDALVALMEENPTVFYDTSELEDLGGDRINDGVTQKTIQEWEEWIGEQMKKEEE